jgi:L-2,4-diaminobutyrate decarboxylase
MSHPLLPLPHDDLDGARRAAEAFVAEALRVLAWPDAGPVSPLADARRPLPTLAPPAAEPAALADVLAEVRAAVIEPAIHLQHPMYMGHQVCPPLPAAAFADALVSVLNQSQAVREMSPSTTAVELALLRWFAGLAGWDPGRARGSFVSGGSAANLTALLAARARAFPEAWRHGLPTNAAVLVGEQAHYSVARAVGIMGLGTDALVRIPTDARGATSPAETRAALSALRAAGRPVLALVATAGSTATGTHDDLSALADSASQAGVWLHVDAAHGASALLSDRHRHYLQGIERVDSLSWDPHKMMFQPLSAALILVRDGSALERAFAQDASYLFQPPEDTPERIPDLGAWTLQCSRRADALRLWLALRLYGTRTIGALYERTVTLAERLWQLLAEAPDFQPLHRPESNILCFRHVAAGDHDPSWQDRLRRRYNASGAGWITAATVRGERALRVTLINPRTTEAHLVRLLEGLRGAAATAD